MSDTIIIVPTYNEKDNIGKLIEEIFRYAPGSDVLVVDDNSPDGTGIIADRIAEIPIVFKKRYKNKTKLNFIKLFRVGMDILSFKKTHLSTA